MNALTGLAVDLGGSHATCAVVRGKQLLAKSVVPIDAKNDRKHFPVLLQTIADRLKRLCDQAGIKSVDAAGLVFGFPGIVDSRVARVVATNDKFDQATEFDFRSWCRQTLKIDIRLENDARLALMGEHYCGAAEGCEDAVLVTIGTGIGTAVILDGKPLRGRSGRAGCLGGHLPVVLHGRLCGCGNLGCAEAEASTWALNDMARTLPGFDKSPLAARPQINFEFLFQCSDAGDATARYVLERCYSVWGALAVALVHAYSPERLLFGGGVMAREGTILRAVQEHVSRHSWCADGSIIQAAALGSDSALYGTMPMLSEEAW